MTRSIPDIDDIVRRVMARLLDEPSRQAGEPPGQTCRCKSAAPAPTASAIEQAVQEVLGNIARAAGDRAPQTPPQSTMPAGAVASKVAAETDLQNAAQASHGGCSCGCRSGRTAPMPTAPASAESSEMPATVRLTQHVVSAADIEGLAAGVQRLDVPQRTVVTPAARDALRDRGIELRRGAHGPHAPSSSTLGSPMPADQNEPQRVRLHITLVCDYDPRQRAANVVDVFTTIDPPAAAVQNTPAAAAQSLVPTSKNT